MEYYQFIILIAQCLIVAIFLLLFFRLRTIFGLGLFYIAIGLFKFMHYFFTQAFSLELASGIHILIGPTIITPAILFSLLLIYIREDAGEVRKIIYALIFFNFFFAAMMRISALGINGAGFVNRLNLPEQFFRIDIGSIIAGSLVLFIDGIVLIVLYEFLSKKISSLFLRIFLTMTSVLFLHALIFNSAAFIFKPVDTSLLRGYALSILISKAIPITVYTVSFWLYLVYFEKRSAISMQTGSSFRDVFNLLTYRQKYEQVFKEKETQKLALQKSEILNKTLIAHLPQRIFIKDLNSVYLSCNRNYATDLGTTPNEMIGKNDFDYFPSELAKVYRADDQKVIRQGDTKKTEERYLLKGEERWIHTIKVPYRDSEDNIIGILGVFEDITERKRAEIELKASEERYRLMLNTTLDGFILADEEGKIMQVNPGYCKMIGYSEQELLSMKIHEIEVLESNQQTKEHIQQLILHGKARFETRHRAKDGHLIDLEVSVSNLKVGEKTLGAAFISNITERKRAEEALKESEEKFQKIINESFSGISVTNEEGKIIVWNNALEKITGINKTETIDQYIWDVQTDLLDRNTVDTKRKEELRSSLLNVLKTGQSLWLNTAMERDYIHPDGSVKRVSGRMYTIQTQKGYLVVSVSQDVTERNLAVKAFKEAQSNLQALLDNRKDSIWSLDCNYNFLVYNKPYADVIYSNMGVRLEKGMNALEIHPKEVNDFWKPKFDEVFNGNYVTFEFSYVLDGKEHFFEVFMNPIYTDNKISGLSALSMDITDRKQAETELKKLSTAVTQSPSIITITDPEGNLQYVNPKFTEITGYSREEVIGKNTRILQSGEYSDLIYKDLWETITSGKIWQGEFHNKKKNGELYWEMASISPIFNKQGKIINYVKVSKDITKQKRNEQIQSIIHNISNAVITSHSLENYLQLVKDELGKLIDTTNFFVALYDEETDSFSLPLVSYEKDRVESFKAYPAGKTMTHYVIKTGKSVLAKKAMIEKLIKSGEVEQVGHLSEMWLGVPLKSENKITGIFAVQSYDSGNAFDEEDVKMLEIISHQISLSIERLKVEEDLKLAKEKAEESNRLKTAFLNNMSHEIRTPLNGITGFIGLLQNSQIDDEAKQEYFEIINKSSKRLINTVTDIIDISRIEAGELKVSKSEVSVNEILKEQYKFFYEEAKSKGIELKYKPSLTDSELLITTDKHKLEGVIINLIKNAIKYTDTGSITFGYEIKTPVEKDVIEFYVKDTGIGIPANRVDAIFNRFEQADIEDTRAFQGSGLGLAIVKSYVEMLGGEIGVKSKEGEGSTFHFSIPYIKSLVNESDAKENIKKEQRTSLSHLSIIIAEDDEVSRMFLETILEDQIKNITFTTTGKETIEKFREKPDTDIILMDIKMPDMNGYKVTREIRKFNQDVIIIAQTAFGLAGDREKAIEAGCNDYISKPIDQEILFEKIGKWVENK